jgi:hypothetical protein
MADINKTTANRTLPASASVAAVGHKTKCLFIIFSGCLVIMIAFSAAKIQKKTK